MRFNIECDSVTILFSTDASELYSHMDKGYPAVQILTSEYDSSFDGIRYAIFLTKEELDDATLCEERGDIPEYLLDELYLRKIIARFYHRPLIISQSDRFIIRELTVEDAAGIVDLYNTLEANGKAVSYIERFYNSYEDLSSVLAKYQNEVYELYDTGIWGIFTKDDKKIVGIAGLTVRYKSDYHLQENDDYTFYIIKTKTPDLDLCYELGYAVRTDYQRLGICTEACKLILKYADELEYNCIYARVHNSNVPGKKVIDKLLK